MNKPERRTPFIFALAARRTAEFYERAGRTRLLLLAVTAGAFALGRSAWWVWVALALAAFGSWLGWGLQRAVLRNTVPQNPLLLWAYNSAVNGHGKHSANVSGVLEGLSCLTLSWACGYGVAVTDAALVALVAVVAFSVSVFSAVFVDNANYNPGDQPWTGFEPLRKAVGALLALLSALIVLPGWPGDSLVPPALACLGGLAASIRVSETDRAFIEADREARESARLAGRDDVLNNVHGLSTDLDRALTYGSDLRHSRPEVFDYVQTAAVRLQQLTALEDPYVDDVGYPESLARAVRRFAGSSWGRCRIEVQQVSEPDHHLARILVHDLVGNAEKAGATRISMSFLDSDGRLQLTVEDDAPHFAAGTWMAPGSSLARLGRTLSDLSGGLTLQQGEATKVVRAEWKAREGDAPE